ncbi:MerR family transcriptional regulator [Amnibacterium kyonggiense]|nr:MerR family transcriptional regulator [Amnibacterium kyonggiense]
MHIGEVADRTGLSHRTLRHYDEVGLVVPSGRTGGGFRLYTETDLQRLLLVRRMKPLGYTLEQMRELLDTVRDLQEDDDPEARARVAALEADVAARRLQLVRQVEMADEFAALLRGL